MESGNDTVAIINQAVSVVNENEITEETLSSSGREEAKDARVVSRSMFLEPIVFLICFAFNLNGK